MGAQAQDTSPNVGIKNGPSTSYRPLLVSLKGRPKTRAQLASLKGWQPKEFVLGENTQTPPIRKVRYFPIITHQLSLINRFTIRKENLLPSGRISYHPPTRKHTIQCHHPTRKHTIQCHHPIRKVVMTIHYKYQTTPSVKGTQTYAQNFIP